MNIKGIFDILQPNPYAAAAKAPAPSSSFGSMLSAESTSASENVASRAFVRYPYNEKNILEVDQEDDWGRTQTIRAQYTADSTPEDPIVRIYGQSHSGSYSYTRRIRDINLEYATYPEMYALQAHQKQLEYERTNGESRFTPVGEGLNIFENEMTLEKLIMVSGFGDFSKKHNFLGEYAERYASDYISFDIQITADETKTVQYGDGMSPEQAAEQAEFERLMRTVDYVIEQQKEQAEQAKEKAEEEEWKRLLAAEEYERRQLLERADEKKRWEVPE